MPARTPDDSEQPVAPATDEPEEIVDPEVIDPEIVDDVVEVDAVEDVEVVVDDEEDEEEEDEDEKVAVVVPAALARPTPRPQPGRPPSAKEEPPPPFAIGERVRLTSNIRPRTGTPIGDYPVGSLGRVETVLSQTAIVRFDRAADIKEVVAFTCLETAEGAVGRGDGPPVPPAPPVPVRRTTGSTASHPVAVLRGVPRPPAPRELPPPAPARLAPAPRPAPSAANDGAASAAAKSSAKPSAAAPAPAPAVPPLRRARRPLKGRSPSPRQPPCGRASRPPRARSNRRRHGIHPPSGLQHARRSRPNLRPRGPPPGRPSGSGT